MEHEIYQPPTAALAVDRPPKASPRRWWVAGLLGLLWVGLGQLYNGQWKKAVAMVLASGILLLAALALMLWGPHPWLGLGLIPLVYLFAAVEAAVAARRLDREYHRKAFNRWYAYLAWGGLVYFGAQGVLLGWSTYVAQPFHIPAASMEPTLQIGDKVLIEKWDPRGREIRRGDLLLFLFPPDPSRPFIKRVVGLPGERIEIRNRRELWVDGRLVPEPYAFFELAEGEPLFSPKLESFGPFDIPEGEYFVLGDNRDNSNDSRFWGTVPEELILGGQRAVIYWSVDPETGELRAERIGRVGG